jgi:hypothetical protein
MGSPLQLCLFYISIYTFFKLNVTGSGESGFLNKTGAEGAAAADNVDSFITYSSQPYPISECGNEKHR